jgi:hypothetical protein
VSPRTDVLLSLEASGLDPRNARTRSYMVDITINEHRAVATCLDCRQWASFPGRAVERAELAILWRREHLRTCRGIR